MAKGNKASKQSIIIAIIKEIEKGESRGKVLGKIGNKWEISRTTFDRYWKIANQQHGELQDKAKEAADLAYIQSSEDAAKKAVMSRAERLERLSAIARGELMVKVNSERGIEDAVLPIEVNEMIKAMAEISKMQGDYAPTKIAPTKLDGSDIEFSLTLNIN